MGVWRAYKDAKAWVVLPAFLTFTAPFIAISTCEKAEKPGEVLTEWGVESASDIEELCKDWLYYRKKILQYTAAGEAEKTERARARFRQVNSMLSKFPESSVNAAFLRLEENRYRP